MKKEIISRILSSDPDSKLYVGCDSSVFKKGKTKWAKFVCVLILHHGGNKGASFLDIQTEICRVYDLKSRLLHEVDLGVKMALDVIPYIGSRKLEVHFDLNPDPNHVSNVAVKEALGYARGMNLTAKIKPNSFAATHAADHMT